MPRSPANRPQRMTNELRATVRALVCLVAERSQANQRARRPLSIGLTVLRGREAERVLCVIFNHFCIHHSHVCGITTLSALIGTAERSPRREKVHLRTNVRQMTHQCARYDARTAGERSKGEWRHISRLGPEVSSEQLSDKQMLANGRRCSTTGRASSQTAAEIDNRK